MSFKKLVELLQIKKNNKVNDRSEKGLNKFFPYFLKYRYINKDNYKTCVSCKTRFYSNLGYNIHFSHCKQQSK